MKLINSLFKICKVIILSILLSVPIALYSANKSCDFLRVNGEYIVDSKGEPFYIKGTNLGNWLNPEGYMFAFKRAASARMINEVFCELVGPEETAKFWKEFKENYITEADIEFIASTGANTIRLPFNYKLFTNEDYLGTNDANEGFRIIDNMVEWCRKNDIRLVLDMHDAPGGQTGDNIDDSYGYPWLMIDKTSQSKFINIWERIANRYKDEPVILGYELINEPIATYWEDTEREFLNSCLEPLYKHTTAAIRKYDSNHIILLGAPQWNSNFRPFSDWSFDDNIMYTCHRYGGDSTKEAIDEFIAFRDKTGLPMYMGETGHNTNEWMSALVDVMRDNNIGYTFWPYKKIEDSSMTGVKTPTGWEIITKFAESPRGSFGEIRDARKGINIDEVKASMYEYIENAKASNMLIHTDYINAIQLNK
jgi:aryl-phospho-beta-D-glucosidase BglC (GH1 family)